MSDFNDFDLLDDMIRVLGRRGDLGSKAIAREVGRSEKAVLEQLTESYYFEPALTGKLGRYALSGKGREQFEKD